MNRNAQSKPTPETRATVYDNAAGLLARMGFHAMFKADHKPNKCAELVKPEVEAIITTAPAVLVGYAIAMVAEEPEAHLPEFSHKTRKPRKMITLDKPVAYWSP